MKYTYQDNELGKVIIRENENGTLDYIPIHESNSDYQAYLKWTEEQNG